MYAVSRMKIIVCEDEAIIGLDIVSILKSKGYSDVVATQNPLALIAEANSSNPCLIITDINLKAVINGIEAIDLIRKRSGKDTGVIFITGTNYSPEEIANDTYTRVIKKPFKSSHLLNVVKELEQLY